MSFAVAAESYDRFMGRFSRPLGHSFADFADIVEGRALDVGCGPGALTEELVRRLGAEAVAAVDPSESFVAAARDRNPGVDVHQATAEALPFPTGHFDACLAQLVVHFLSDPVGALSEMKRVTRSGGVVAACVWDHAGGSGPMVDFWNAARHLDPGAGDQSDLPGTRVGHLAELFEEADLSAVSHGSLSVDFEFETFEQWWEPFTLGVGPAGAHVASLKTPERDELREQCRRSLPSGPFVVTARAWAARGVA